MSMVRLNNRTKGVACLFALFLGGLGAHKFYLGQPEKGILYLLFCWTGIPSLVSYMEILIYLSKSSEEFDREHNYR